MKNTIILLAPLFVAAIVFGQSVAIVSEQTTTLTATLNSAQSQSLVSTAYIGSGSIVRNGDNLVISGTAFIKVPVAAIGSLVTLPAGITADNFTSGSFQLSTNADGSTSTAITVTFTK